MLFTLFAQAYDRLEVIVGTPLNLDVYCFIERVAGDGHNIQVFAILSKPSLRHLTIICDDGDRL